MKRLIDAQLLNWKDSSRRKPLIIRGGRQIGKTWSIEKLGLDSFNSFAKIDLEKRRDLHGIFEGDLSSGNILSQLSVVLQQPIVPGETLLFFDEIQACPRALMALRFLYEEIPELHVIAAGSLLEFASGDISFPVGRVQFLNMYPLAYVEFLLAGGYEQLVAILQDPPTRQTELVHQLLLNHLRQYFFVGGLPEAVEAYYDGAEKNGAGLLNAFEVQSEIIDTYRLDFAKYAPRANKFCLDNVLTSCAVRVGEQIKYSTLAGGFSNPTIRKAFDLLVMAKIIHKIPAARTIGIPIGADVNQKKFKVSLIDIGLMRRLSGIPVDIEIRQPGLLDIYRGKLAEQFVAQEICAMQKNDLYYWARDARGSSAEVDYLISGKAHIHPVEVKSGSTGSLKSLHMALSKYPDSGEGLVLSTGHYAELAEQRIRFIPLYYAGSMLATLSA
ncbi:MAG: AAA family ATPase [bacterium]|nr:ATP-binding protein [Gammaproteobacteria bacterium]HIL96280.1 ATP-binding protein [Pseudomonadales bacterium]